MTIIFRTRRPAKALSYRKRFNALTSNEQVKLRKIKSSLCALLLYQKYRKDITLVTPIKLLCLSYLNILSDREHDKVVCRPNLHRTIDSFTQSECFIYFRFRKPELKRLYPLLGFPDKCILLNGSAMPGTSLIHSFMFHFNLSVHSLFHSFMFPFIYASFLSICGFIVYVIQVRKFCFVGFMN